MTPPWFRQLCQRGERCPRNGRVVQNSRRVDDVESRFAQARLPQIGFDENARRTAKRRDARAPSSRDAEVRSAPMTTRSALAREKRRLTGTTPHLDDARIARHRVVERSRERASRCSRTEGGQVIARRIPGERILREQTPEPPLGPSVGKASEGGARLRSTDRKLGNERNQALLVDSGTSRRRRARRGIADRQANRAEPKRARRIRDRVDERRERLDRRPHDQHETGHAGKTKAGLTSAALCMRVRQRPPTRSEIELAALPITMRP